MATTGTPVTSRKRKTALPKLIDKYYADLKDLAHQTLVGIPPETYDYRLGNRSALEWVIDQHQVYTDPRSNITSDPNREDNPQYITRLIGQVVRVSMETVKIVESLPAEFADTALDTTD